MFKRASFALASALVLAVPAMAAIRTGTAAPKVNTFSFCARPIVGSYSHQPVVERFGGENSTVYLPYFFLPW